jgi:hypothetical protein
VSRLAAASRDEVASVADSSVFSTADRPVEQCVRGFRRRASTATRSAIRAPGAGVFRARDPSRRTTRDAGPVGEVPGGQAVPY